MIELFETPEGDKHTKHFLPRELRCRCEHCKMQKPHGYTDAQLIKIEKLRLAIGRAYTPNSAYRCPQHPIEAAKANPGEGPHTLYGAEDIPCHGAEQRGKVVSEALALGAKGIGIDKSYVHVDWRPGTLFVWNY